MDNRRLLIAFLLSILVLFVWRLLLPPPPAPSVPEVGAPRAAEAPPAPAPPPLPEATAGTGSAAGEGAPLLGEPTTEEPPLDLGGERVVGERAETVVLESGRVRAELSTEGAQLVSFTLKEHRKSEGEAIDLVRHRGSDPYPFALTVDREKSHPLNRALFRWERLDDGGLLFQHQSELGSAEKRFRLSEDGFLEVEIAVGGAASWGVVLGPGLRNPSGEEAGGRFLKPMVAYQRGTGVETLQPRKQEEDATLSGLGLGWVALEDNYFLTAVVPQEGVQEVLVRPVVERDEFEPGTPRFSPFHGGEEESGTHREQLLILESAGGRMQLLAYFGAKRYSKLASLPYGLERTVDFGKFFGFLARGLYYGLEWIYANVVGNYGWAIVLMTFLIKLVLFPATHRGQVSMGKMQALNPKVQAIRNKFRGKLKDKQGRPNVEAQKQMNDEIMAVYRSAGVNPVGGCLPMLLQLPVFYAFFRLLSAAVELRNAPWILWIHDLSARDPYSVLPLAMGATSLLLQRMTPSSPDPMQRRMMQLMPIMFTFFAFAFPSGLVIYWLTNNLLTMVQQGAYLRYKKRREESEKAGGSGGARGRARKSKTSATEAASAGGRD